LVSFLSRWRSLPGCLRLPGDSCSGDYSVPQWKLACTGNGQGALGAPAQHGSECKHWRHQTVPWPLGGEAAGPATSCGSWHCPSWVGDGSLQLTTTCPALPSRFKISKIIVVGDLSVGKTCLINRFCKDTFDKNYKATIGVDFEMERFEVLGVPFSLQLWDTAGQERFKCIASTYYRGAQAIVIVFDVNDVASLAHTRYGNAS
ncbi:ras-related protein Rab-36-like, partial [Terrapene carolina triunguis]|uniref:ras-related protein Rab-36-like n=1 Tax=Terrapene triunguis TaxID=2587831 RepID=UPI001156AC50